MTSLSESFKPVSEHIPFVKFFLYGPAGAGKTTLAAGAPDPGFVDSEKSTETLRNTPGLENIRVNYPKSFIELYATCREVVAKKEFKTIVIESIGRVQANQMKADMDVVTRKPDGSRSRDPLVPVWDDYKKSTYILDDFFSFLQDAPINVIITAHSTEDRDPQTKALLKIRPDITPSLNESLVGLINVVGYLEVITSISGVAERKLTVNPLNKIVAKNRLNIQTPTIKNPTFKEIFKQ